MRLDQLSLQKRKRKKRVGRGNASGHGTYSGRGMKGQKARAGARIRTGFEGGQTPIYQRLPKVRGARGGSRSRKVRCIPVNLDDLEKRFPAGTQIDRGALIKSGLVPRRARLIKILGWGELKKSFTVKLPVSKSAKEKIEKAGGKVDTKS